MSSLFTVYSTFKTYQFRCSYVDSQIEIILTAQVNFVSWNIPQSLISIKIVIVISQHTFYTNECFYNSVHMLQWQTVI